MPTHYEGPRNDPTTFHPLRPWRFAVCSALFPSGSETSRGWEGSRAYVGMNSLGPNRVLSLTSLTKIFAYHAEHPAFEAKKGRSGQQLSWAFT